MATKKELEQENLELKKKLELAQSAGKDLLEQHQKDNLAYNTLIKEKEEFLKEIEKMKKEKGGLLSLISWLKNKI